jgi:hypothetical protein
MGRRKLLVFCEEQRLVDSTQMIATAMTTGVQTLKVHCQPGGEGGDDGVNGL